MEADLAKDNRKSQIANHKSRPTGAREDGWGEGGTVNIQTGCEHDCRYCYARHDAVHRWHRCTRTAWAEPVIDAGRVDQEYPRFKGRVMFPSTHDITMRNASECLVVLRKLLEAGNEVLIVSKPSMNVTALLVEALKRWQHHVAFRFTIGSASDNVLSFWEPGAPNFENRIKSLSCAYYEGYCTSVSCEPYLDEFAPDVYQACCAYLSRPPFDRGAGGFWIGKLRRWDSRVDLSGATDEQIEQYVEPLRAAQGDEFIRAMVGHLSGRPFIRWKDSIREVIEKPPQRISATDAVPSFSREDTEENGLREIDKGID